MTRTQFPPALRRSPPLGMVLIEGGFWGERLEIVRRRTMPHILEQLESVGVIDAFRAAAGRPISTEPALAADSDLYKWIEAASYVLSWADDAELRLQVDDLVCLIGEAQEDDGYLNTFYTVNAPERRWTNLRDSHEMYCAGHLFEAAVAHHDATGDSRFVEVARRFADHLDARFGTENGKVRGYCGHPEVELALVRLADCCGEPRYLRLAEYFVRERGREPYFFDIEAAHREPDNPFGEVFEVNTGLERRRYNQTHLPVAEQFEMAGHAVRAMYLYSAATEVASRTSDPNLARAVRLLFEDLVDRHLYVTGGVGASRTNEGFAGPYDLPNDSAYAETCASIGLVFWAFRLAAADGTSAPLDVLERALYNTVLGGMSEDGEAFFYENRLKDDGSYVRRPWHKVACCPPNIARLLANLGSYLYLVGDRDVTVCLYASSSAAFDIAGSAVRIKQETDYPLGGTVKLTIEVEEPVRFTLRLRVPSGTELLEASGVDAGANADGFVVLDDLWSGRRTISLEFELPPRLVFADPRVSADAGRVAVERGPLVFCLEQPPREVSPSSFVVEALHDAETPPLVRLGGRELHIEADRPLYGATPPVQERTMKTAVPFYARGNRGAAAYAVWLIDGIRRPAVE